MTKVTKQGVEISADIVEKKDNDIVDIDVLHATDNKLLAELGYKAEFKREFSVLVFFHRAYSIQGLTTKLR